MLKLITNFKYISITGHQEVLTCTLKLSNEYGSGRGWGGGGGGGGGRRDGSARLLVSYLLEQNPLNSNRVRRQAEND